MTDITDRIKEVLEGYHKGRRDFGAVIARDSLSLSARTLLPEALKEIEELRSRAEAAEAKLAVAVEALEDQLRSDEAEVRVFYTSGQANPPVERRIDRTRATLAEIKGEKP